jgi:hypothetical protein
MIVPADQLNILKLESSAPRSFFQTLSFFFQVLLLMFALPYEDIFPLPGIFCFSC